MDHTQQIILTPFNYFYWKAQMEILLRSKGLYRVTMATEAEPTSAVEKSKWHNRRNEAYGMLCLTTSRELLFHLDGLTSPNEVWLKLQELFSKIDELRGHQLDNELVSLSPQNFDNLQELFSKFKSLVLQLKQCGIHKKDEQLVLAILSKLGPDYSIFVSTFHSTQKAIKNWKSPSLS